MTPLNRTVLVVDDEGIIVTLWTIHVESMGVPVCGSAATAADAVMMAQQHRPAVVLMDVRLRGSADGVSAAIEIHERVGSKVIFITGSQEPSTIDRIKADHPAAILIKPVPSQVLQHTVDAVLGAWAANP